jgi:Putative Actinobacterial Holin-X, holin superfamily III
VSETSEAPQDGVAEALHDLSDQTRALVRREISAGQREMWDKAKQSGPALALLAGSGTLMLFAAASFYRLSLRLLERRLSPAASALVATAGYGAGAAVVAVLGYRRLREAPLPVPADTARETAGALREADEASAARSGT